MKTNIFKKFIYLAAVQLILVSQLLVVAVALTTNPIYAESGSGSEGTVTEESTSGSNSGSSSTENTDSGTSGGDTNPTDESAGAVEQTTDTTDSNTTDGSNSGTGSTQDSATTDTQSNSGTGNAGDTQQAPAEEAAGQIAEEEEPAPVAEEVVVEETEEPVVEEPAPEEPVVGSEEVVADGEVVPADVATDEEAPVDQAIASPTDAAIGEIDPVTGFPVSYQDQTGAVVVPCLDGSDPNCVLPEAGEEAGFDPSQPTELGTNFPSEFFYWIAESNNLETPLGGKTFIRFAVEGAFVNEEPVAGDQMVFGRIRVTGTDLQPNAEYTVTHPYGTDTYTTDDEGIITRKEGTEDIGCDPLPGESCDFSLALDSRIFQSFLSWDNGAPEGYLGDAITPHTVTGSPTGNNFFRIEGAGLPEGGLFTDLFTVAGKLLSGAGSVIGDLVGGGTPAEEPVDEEPVVEEEEVDEEAVTDEEVVSEAATDSNSSSDSSSEAASTSTNSGTDNSSQNSSNQTQTAALNNSDDNSGNTSGETSGTTGGSSESEQRGSVAEGEIAGVDEEQIAADGIAADDTVVLGAFSENLTSEGGQTEPTAVAAKEQSKQTSVDPLEILLALAALAIAGGLITGSAFGNLKLQRYLDIKKIWRFR